jgi:hypothetical protein
MSCDNTNDKLDEDLLEVEDVKEAEREQDSIVDYYTEAIYAYYHKANFEENEIEIELRVKGERAYETDSILIISFNEVLEFGSWHYTDASLLFFKNGKDLIPIALSLEGEGVLNDFYKKDIQYPNRIDGVLHQIIDLTGDGKDEYIFRATGSIRVNFEERYTIYHLNPDTRKLERDSLSIYSQGVQADCDTIYGELGSFRIIKNRIVEVKEVVSTCIDSLFKVQELTCTFTYYIWDKEEHKFKKLPSLLAGFEALMLDEGSDSTATYLAWENEYFNLEIQNLYKDCALLVRHDPDVDSIYMSSEFGCSIISTPFKLTLLKLDSVEVAQSQFEYISISMPPSDGFDAAILNEPVLQSKWVSYDLKNELYIPFSQEDPRFEMKNKPKLSTSFINDLLKRSDRAVAAELWENFMQTDKQIYWVNCSAIIRITGVDKKGKRITKYIIDNELCLQD